MVFTRSVGVLALDTELTWAVLVMCLVQPLGVVCDHVMRSQIGEWRWGASESWCMDVRPKSSVIVFT